MDLKTGIVIPLPQEVKTLTSAKLSVHIPYYWKKNIVLIRSGVGRRNARIATQLLLNENISLLISWGTCVSLTPGVKCGDLILPGHVVDSTGNKFVTHNGLRKQVSHKVSHLLASKETILSETEHLLSSPEEKNLIHQKWGSTVADMESGVLASMAEEHHLTLLVIRAVSDTIHMKIPEAVKKGVDQWGKVQWRSFLFHTFKNYRQIPDLLQLSTGLQQAQRTLSLVGTHLPGIIV